MTWSTEHELLAQATPRAVWNLWRDHTRWSEWNTEIRTARLDGPFEEGTSYRLRFRASLPMRFEITTLVEEREFTDEGGNLPGARMGHQRQIVPEDARVRIRNRVYLDGPLARVYGALIGRRLRRSVRDFVEREKALAERDSAAERG